MAHGTELIRNGGIHPKKESKKHGQTQRKKGVSKEGKREKRGGRLEKRLRPRGTQDTRRIWTPGVEKNRLERKQKWRRGTMGINARHHAQKKTRRTEVGQDTHVKNETAPK